MVARLLRGTKKRTSMNLKGLSGSLHKRSRAYSMATGKPMCRIVENLLEQHSEQKRIGEIVERARKALRGGNNT